jgi:hypothetical protein
MALTLALGPKSAAIFTPHVVTEEERAMASGHGFQTSLLLDYFKHN